MSPRGKVGALTGRTSTALAVAGDVAARYPFGDS